MYIEGYVTLDGQEYNFLGYLQLEDLRRLEYDDAMDAQPDAMAQYERDRDFQDRLNAAIAAQFHVEQR